MANIKRIEGKNGPSFKITVTRGRNIEGKQIRHYMTWKPERPMTDRQMEKEAQRVAFEFEKDLDLGFQLDKRQTFNEYAHYVIDLKRRAGVSEATLFYYARMLKRISSDFGCMKISDIRPQHINRFYDQMMQPGAKNTKTKFFPIVDIGQIIKDYGGYKRFKEDTRLHGNTICRLRKKQPVFSENAQIVANALQKDVSEIFRLDACSEAFSPKSIKIYHGFIVSVFAQAEKEMLLPYNPAAKATPPKAQRVRPIRSLQPEELERIVDALEKIPIHQKTLFYFLMVTGCRRGEALALKWENIDFQSGEVRIEKSLSYLPNIGIFEGETKTRTTRIVILPEKMLKQLRLYRAWQNELRLSVGALWEDTGYVFTAQYGGAMMPANVNKVLTKFCKRYDLPHINPHMFRHTAASIMISRGVDVLTVAKMLGHSKPSTTLDVYGHVIDEAKRNAAECIADVILRQKNA